MNYKNGAAPQELYDIIGVWAECGLEGWRYYIDYAEPRPRGLGQSWLETQEPARPHLYVVPDIGEVALDGAEQDRDDETALTA